jgi:phosphate butyryltransferase
VFQNLDELVSAALKKGPARIAVAAGQDPDVLESLQKAQDINLALPTLIGQAEKILALGQEVGFKISEDQIIHEPDELAAARMAISLIRDGRADLLMKGKLSTALLLRAVLDKEQGLRTGRLLSQVIVFQVPGFSRLMLMTDAAINIAPSLEQKAEICRNAIDVAHTIDIKNPNLALLCAIEFANPDMPATVDAAALTMMNRRGQISGAYLEGPIALDVPLSRFAAERKNIHSPLVENTDIFVAPDIEAANILYRAILYFAGGESAGIVVGAKVPLVLLSRAETPETKIRSIALAVLAAGTSLSCHSAQVSAMTS